METWQYQHITMATTQHKVQWQQQTPKRTVRGVEGKEKKKKNSIR
jgi:hypothetical protein